MPESRFSSYESSDRRIALITAVLTLSNLSICLHRSSRVYLYQQSQCLSYYLATDPSLIGPGFVIDEKLCKNKDIQSPLSIIEGLDGSLAISPALIALAIYQRLLPIAGLRNLILFNLVFAAFGVLFSMILFSFHRPWTIVGILLTCIFDVIGGGDIVRIILCLTSVAELAAADQLTKCYNYITALYLLASVTASLIGWGLLSHHVYLLNTLALICFALAILLAFFIPINVGRNKDEDASFDESNSSFLMGSQSSSRSTSPERALTPTSRRPPSILTVILASWRTSYTSLSTLFQVPNPIFTILIIYLLHGISTKVEVLLPQYLSLTLHWTLATVNAALAIKAFVAALVLLLLPWFREHYLKPKGMNTLQIDLMISKASLLANSIGMLGLSFSALPAALIVPMLCVYTMGIGFTDSLASFGTLALPAGVGTSDYFLRIGLIDGIAGLIAAPLWSAIFSACLKSQAVPISVPFWTSAALFTVGAVSIGKLRRWAADAPPRQA